jgi:DNA-repair protein complementing XP-A cells
MATTRPTTPPPSAPSNIDITPEQVRRLEINRLKAKGLREQQRQAEAAASAKSALTPSTNATAGHKRPYDAIVSTRSTAGPNSRDGAAAGATAAGAAKAHDAIQPARKFARDAYIEYDFAKMTDTKGGFLTAEDDPHNKALHVPDHEQKPAHMTLKEWERHLLLKKLRDQKAGPFEPSLNGMKRDGPDGKQEGCRECQSLEIDWQWLEIFGCRVCMSCKDKFPDKYSLLTKTEVREDYLLTEPELKDPDLLPHLERPNPHKSTWNNMMLFLRYQVEEYALSEKKWGSAEKLDEEYQKREKEKKQRKEKKFADKLKDLKKRTRVEAVRRNRGRGGGDEAGREAQFGDVIRNRGDRHEHEWGRAVENEEGLSMKKCVECGMEVEELEF